MKRLLKLIGGVMGVLVILIILGSLADDGESGADLAWKDRADNKSSEVEAIAALITIGMLSYVPEDLKEYAEEFELDVTLVGRDVALNNFAKNYASYIKRNRKWAEKEFAELLQTQTYCQQGADKDKDPTIKALKDRWFDTETYILVSSRNENDATIELNCFFVAKQDISVHTLYEFEDKAGKELCTKLKGQYDFLRIGGYRDSTCAERGWGDDEARTHEARIKKGEAISSASESGRLRLIKTVDGKWKLDN